MARERSNTCYLCGEKIAEEDRYQGRNVHKTCHAIKSNFSSIMNSNRADPERILTLLAVHIVAEQAKGTSVSANTAVRYSRTVRKSIKSFLNENGFLKEN